MISLITFLLVARPWLAAPVILQANSATNQSSVPTDQVGKTLQGSKLSFKDIDGFYQLKFTYEDVSRQQTAYIRKEVYTYNSLAVQECFSIFYESTSPPSSELLLRFFAKSLTIGGLILEAPSEKQKFWRIRFRYEIPINSSIERIRTYLEIVASTADTFEKELGPEDKQ